MIRRACGAYKERYIKQNCSFGPRYAPNCLSTGTPVGAYSAPPDPLAGLGGGAARPGNETDGGRGREGRRGYERGSCRHPEIFRWIDAFGYIIPIIYQDDDW